MHVFLDLQDPLDETRHLGTNCESVYARFWEMKAEEQRVLAPGAIR